VTGAVAGDLDLRAVSEGVDHRHADTVEATGHRVGLAVELPAGMQGRERHLDGGTLLGRMEVDGDAAAVVADLQATVVEDADRDALGMAREVLVDRVVDDLPHEVVQPAAVGRSDVHRRTLPDALEPLEDADVLRAVLGHDAPGVRRSGWKRTVGEVAGHARQPPPVLGRVRMRSASVRSRRRRSGR
jgi:hypothetical protein